MRHPEDKEEGRAKRTAFAYSAKLSKSPPPSFSLPHPAAFYKGNVTLLRTSGWERASGVERTSFARQGMLPRRVRVVRDECRVFGREFLKTAGSVQRDLSGAFDFSLPSLLAGAMEPGA
ncbi:hypothetical protein E2320_009783 [Naja naja]|nr:hypothetical protein E2320_009783 [Naja naja]